LKIPILYIRTPRVNGCEYFHAVFPQPSQISGLPGGVNRFCKISSVYSQLTRTTDGQTDGNVISIAERAIRNAH